MIIIFCLSAETNPNNCVNKHISMRVQKWIYYLCAREWQIYIRNFSRSEFSHMRVYVRVGRGGWLKRDMSMSVHYGFSAYIFSTPHAFIFLYCITHVKSDLCNGKAPLKAIEAKFRCFFLALSVSKRKKPDDQKIPILCSWICRHSSY